MRRPTYHRWLTASLLPLLALGGCSGDSMRDLKAFVAEVKERPRAPIQPIPEISQIETFTYVAEGKRDPFSPVVDDRQRQKVAPSSGPVPNFLRPKEELEQFPLDSLRMVGSVEKQGDMWALVRSTDRVIHRVKAGNYLGQNHGQITRITEEAVQLTEIVPDGQGGYRERMASLDLAE
jgi:type IV pilus assembly protein PilP